MPSFDHIHLRNLGTGSDGFKTTDTARTKRPPERTDRRDHGDHLHKRLVNLKAMFAKAADLQADMGVPEKKRGSVVTIESVPTREIDVGDRRLEHRDRSILGIRRRQTNSGPRDEARVFFTEKGFEKLLEKADQYREWNSVGRRPHYFWLFETAETFRPAEVEDFWNDEPARLDMAIKNSEWEVWTRRSMDTQLRTAIKALDLERHGKATTFQELKVYNIVATRKEIRDLIEASAAVVELRGASSFVARDHQLPPAERQVRALKLQSRLQPANSSAPIVTLLDTGVNREHPLLQKSLPAGRCHAAHASWDPLDPDGHGTKMAGIALFGDMSLAMASTGPVVLPVRLESVAISAPGNPDRLPARDALARAIAIVEKKPARRVFCLAATAVGEAESGVPTSTSATLDLLAFGDGDETRLICAAVGNVDTNRTTPYRIAHYKTQNRDHRVQSPAQALNALSVGAATMLCSTTNLVAPVGDLSPTSRTALAWDRPHKPDIVMEGGNHKIDDTGRTSAPHPDDMLMTTSRDFTKTPLTVTGETSAATAAASRLAALVMGRYPNMRAETVRGLIVNSARWTPAMEVRRQALIQKGMSVANATNQSLACYGWGIPDENRLFESAGNALTLVVEDTLRPYERAPDKRVRLREMKYFKLPWPDDALQRLGGTEVEVRCTLSYFAEPDPGATSRNEPGRYQGHKLKFDFKRHGETDEQAQRRFNGAVETEAGDGDETGWTLGRFKNRGTLHQDVWTGPAYLLCERNGISVAPNHGWWSESGSSPEDRTVPFSLIVTVSTPDVTADLYTEALSRVPVDKLVAAQAVAI